MVMTQTFWARGDSANANNSYLNSTNTSKFPTTKITFTSGTNGNIKLDYNNGGIDPNTQVTIGANTYDFRLEFTANMPIGKKLANVEGLNVQGKQVAVVTVMNGPNGTAGSRLYFLTDGSGTREVMNGLPNGSIKLTNYSPTGGPVLICFGNGTLIMTPEGEVRVEDLCVGDLVSTQGGGAKPIRWIGKRDLSGVDFILHPNLRPIRVPAETFGAGQPHSDLWLSRQHRVLVEGWEVELNFGCEQVLVPIGQLVGDCIHVDADREAITYYHLLFDAHEIVLSNGLCSESYQPGARSLAGMDTAARRELFTLFPELETAQRRDAATSVNGMIARLLSSKQHRKH